LFHSGHDLASHIPRDLDFTNIDNEDMDESGAAFLSRPVPEIEMDDSLS
jgi:hypothetical protein